MIEALKVWLRSYPGWEGEPLVDKTGPVPGHTGLFPQGVEVLSHREDVLGNTACRCRASFLLLRVSRGGEEDAKWLLDFQDWVRGQSLAGMVPQFGENTFFQARGGRKQEGHTPGMAVHRIELMAEYTVQREG